MAAPMEDAESLFTDVSEVQKELEKFSVNSVDANEIYELLETHCFRSDRVEYVTSHLLFNLGLKSDNVIDISDESSGDGILDDNLYITSPEYDVPEFNDTAALDLSVPGPHCIMNSLITDNENEGKQVLINSDSVNNDSSSIGPCTSGGIPKTIPLDKSDKTIPLDHSDRDNTESNCMISSAVVKSVQTDAPCVESSIAVIKMESANENNYPPYQNDHFLYDVNNNDPNNNTEYEAPMAVENKKATEVPTNEPDDIEMEFQDQEEVRSKLLGEARLIHRIVPTQNLEQIYSYLEANLDRKNRLQIVMQEFLKMELSSEVCTVPQNDGVNIPNDSDCLSDRVKNKDTNLQSSTVSEQEIDNTKKNLEPQPSTSSNGKSKKLKTINKTGSFKVEACTSSVSKLKKHVEKTNPQLPALCEEDELKASSCNVDGAGVNDRNLIKVVPEIENSVTDDANKQASGEVSSSSLSVDENHMEQNYEDINITSTTSIDVASRPDENVNADIDTNSFVTSETIINKIDDFAPPKIIQEAAVPSTSTENTDLVSSHSNIKMKRKSDSADESSPGKKNKIDEDPTKIAIPELTESQRKYKSSLLEMFPDIDPEYLYQRCAKLDNELGLNVVITDLLQNNYPLRPAQETAPEPQPGPSVSVSLEEKIEAQYKTLLAILPNADPSYLHDQCETMAGNEDAMKDFVSDALENKKYPTREEYLKRQEALSLQKKYTEQFSIEGFLEILPDPFKYFNDEKKSTVNILNYAMPYLKARYKKIRQQDISSVFKRNDYNLTKTCDSLDNFSGTHRKTKRSEYECKIPPEVNIPFLQEVAFIENKVMIQEYLKEKKKHKKKAFKLAKSKGELLECGCCFDTEVMVEDIATCNEGHLFCKDCIRKFAEIKIGNGETAFPCLSDCGSEFSLKTLQVVLKPSIFSRMLQRKQLEEVKAAGIEDLETCPFCDFASIPPRDDKVFRCLNPDCMRESCRNCKEPNHIPLRCEEVEKADEVKVRTYIEDRMTEALVRTCCKCQKKFIKEDGCNKMTCMCGAMMCYICRQPVKDYSHFNGQGGDAHHKCPLYSNNDTIHVNPVKQEAEKAKEEMKALNPNLNLKHDPTKMLPQAARRNNALQAVPAHHVHMGHRFHVPGINVHIPHNERRNLEAQMAVQVLAGHVNIHHVFNVPGRFGLVNNPHPRAHVQIEAAQPQNPAANHALHNARVNPDPIPLFPIPVNPHIRRVPRRVRHRIRIRGLEEIGVQQIDIQPNLHYPDAVPQHLPIPAQVGNAHVIPQLPPAAP